MKTNPSTVRARDDMDGLGAESRLLASAPAALRTRVHAALTDPRVGGRGLRAWLALTEVDDRLLPQSLPSDLFTVYLTDPEAEPLYDCERCGLPVPVRAGRRTGHEPSCDRIYFSACPHCGGRTGPHAFWSRTGDK